MKKKSFIEKKSVHNYLRSEEDIRVTRILWFSLGFISALILIYIGRT